MNKIVILSPKQKALSINLDNNIYGTVVEAGAGQEVVRHFFRAGGASGTVAKAMSAYDKYFSNSIYGKEKNNRHVCSSRLNNMLYHEYKLITNRLKNSEHKGKSFFTYANTICTINYEKTNQGHGWMGVRFQTSSSSKHNDVIIHIRLHDPETSLQQETVGVLGINLIYACYNHYKNPKKFIKSLYDNLSRDKVEIDTIKMNGVDFEKTDNRLLSLTLVKEGMTDAVMFGPNKENLQPADTLYKKNILTIRGSFKPVTKVNLNMKDNGYKEFIEDNKVNKKNVLTLFEITLSNLTSGKNNINEKDFLDRADMLCELGQYVLISNYKKYYKLVEYLSKFTKQRMGLIIGVDTFVQIFEEKYYRNLNGGILEAFGILLTRDIKIYLYPFKNNKKLLTSQNLPIHYRVKPLFNYLLKNKRIIDLDYDENILGIFSKKVLTKIRKGDKTWTKDVPKGVDEIIKSKKLFGYK